MKIESSVPRVVSPTLTEFSEAFELPHRPVVISDATGDWKAHSAWTLDYLKDTIGKKKIRVKESPTNVHPDLFSNASIQHAETDFEEYINLIGSNEPQSNRRYLSGDEIQIVSNYTKIDSALAPLRNDISIPKYCNDQNVKTIGFWLSAKGLVASLHYDSDGSHNLNVQVRGRKRVLLFSPNQSLYPFSGLVSNAHPNFSRINIVSPDELHFPGFRNARCQEAILEEGDMLFIPSYWYHAVFHEGDVNINVNFWWQPKNFVLSKTSFHACFLQILYSAILEGNAFSSRKERQLAFDSLSPETRGLLRKIEESIPRQYRI